MIVTVTLNAALDRTLTVPNFQLGHRHRASQGLTLAGGKGINVARALKRLDVPVVATGLAGGRTGTRIVEELTSEAILNDFVRIADESRTSTELCNRAASRGSKRPAPTSSVDAAPAATALRSESSSDRWASSATSNPASKTSPDPTAETGSTWGASARNSVRFRSARKSPKLRDSEVMRTLRAPMSAIRSRAIV